MKILYDHQIFALQRYGGISRYFYELIKCLKKDKDINIFLSLQHSNNYYIFSLDDMKYMKFLPKLEFRGKKRLTSFLNQWVSTLKIKQQKFDIFHPTYYDTYFLKYINNKPFVLTVYDMIHERFNDLFSESDNISLNKRLLCNKASKIIAISESTKKDLIELFAIEESKIEVVYLGNSMSLDHTVELNILVPKNYILFVGSRSVYKNFDKFIHSIASLLHENADLSIVCVGGGQFTIQELISFGKLGIENKMLQFNLEDHTLAQLYSKALMFVFPSLYEGFGIPILEAFSCSCPLVCSNTSSFPEIAGDGAEYFDPYSEESMYEAIKKVLYDDGVKDKLIKNGTERLKKFSWERTARETKKIYESIL